MWECTSSIEIILPVIAHVILQWHGSCRYHPHFIKMGPLPLTEHRDLTNIPQILPYWQPGGRAGSSGSRVWALGYQLSSLGRESLRVQDSLAHSCFHSHIPQILMNPCYVAGSMVSSGDTAWKTPAGSWFCEAPTNTLSLFWVSSLGGWPRQSAAPTDHPLSFSLQDLEF